MTGGGWWVLAEVIWRRFEERAQCHGGGRVRGGGWRVEGWGPCTGRWSCLCPRMAWCSSSTLPCLPNHSSLTYIHIPSCDRNICRVDPGYPDMVMGRKSPPAPVLAWEPRDQVQCSPLPSNAVISHGQALTSWLTGTLASERFRAVEWCHQLGTMDINCSSGTVRVWKEVTSG